MARGQIRAVYPQPPCGSWSGPPPSEGRIGNVMRFAGTPGPGTRARRMARASTVSGETLPVGPGFTQNQYSESQSQPRCPLNGGGRRRFETIGVSACFTSKLTVPLTVQSRSSFVSVAVTVSVPGASAIPKASFGGGSPSSGSSMRRRPATSKLLTV